jgi:hypothetical protein
MSAIDRVRASWAPDQVQHTTNRWANALAGTGGLRQHVTGMTRKALALDYTPQEWLADILEVAARAAEQFEDVAPGHALAFDYDDEAESSGPLYATMEGEDVNGLFQLSLKPTPSTAPRGAAAKRRWKDKEFRVLAKVRREDEQPPDPNLEYLLPAKYAEEFSRAKPGLHSVSLLSLQLEAIPSNSKGMRAYHLNPPPPGKYEGELEVHKDVVLSVRVHVRAATPFVPPELRALANVIDQVPIVASQLDLVLPHLVSLVEGLENIKTVAQAPPGEAAQRARDLVTQYPGVVRALQGLGTEVLGNEGIQEILTRIWPEFVELLKSLRSRGS